MASGSKRERVKVFFRQSFSLKKGKVVSSDVETDTPTPSVTARPSDVVVTSSARIGVPETAVAKSSNQVLGCHASSSGGIFNNARDFSLRNPIFVDNPTNMTVNIRDDKQSQGMKHLSNHTMHGAAHDSSARDPPPRCHPGTRIDINKHIITWFYDEEKQALLVWVYGPAGVGKSAIMQTLAERLADSEHLGASVFVSRTNGRNSSKQLFLTIGYQLAVHIEDYCTIIAEKLARDPELVDKGMEEQFKVFIMEPFVKKKVGAGAKPWGILLDGLDELDDLRLQKEIIRLIADFVLKHPDVPLLWAIASGPEPHIGDTFDEEKVVPAYWKKHVPANSQQSSRDVERFLRDNLERIQKEFPRTVPKEWPSEGQFSSLAADASGLFIFAATAIRFIEDPQYADPTMRLNQVLSTLNGLTASSHNQPFVRLDALYTSILNAIPPEVWPTTKRILGVLLYAGRGEIDVLKKLVAVSIILGLDMHTIYVSINGCYSLLNVSDSKDAHSKPTTFYHTSFGDYLLDLSRSQTFHISLEDVEKDLLKSSINVWQKFKTDYPPTPGLTYQNRWFKYFSVFVSYKRLNVNFLYELMQYIHEALFIFLVEKHNLKGGLFSSEEDRNQCFDLLSQLEDATICGISWDIHKLSEFLPWLFDIWEVYQDELVSRGVIQVGRLEQVQFSQIGTCLDPIEIICGQSVLKTQTNRVAGFDELFHAISHLKAYFPKLPVLACGSSGSGCLLLRHRVGASELQDYDLDPLIHVTGILIWRYFVISFPQPCFYNDAEHFLKVNLEKIQTSYSQLVPPVWPSKKQFLKLAGAVAHQPVFADIAIRFIEDPHFGDPIIHFDQLLALIDEVDFSIDQPFIYVDALYTHILNSISSDKWQTTQQVLSVLLYCLTYYRSSLKSPKGISIALGIELDVVYAALNDCYPMILIPPKDIFLGSITFCFASFCEYLVDPTRSKKFHISKKDKRNQILEVLVNMWQDFRKQCHGITDESMWNKYCSQYHPDIGASNLMILDFNDDLLHDMHEALFTSIRQYGPAELESKQIQDRVFDILSQLDYFTVTSGFWWFQSEFVPWLFDIWDTYQEKLSSQGLFHEVQFQELQFDHLEGRRISHHTLHCNVSQGVQEFFGKEPKSQEELEEYISGLQLFQQHRPQLPVLIGGISGGHFALFEYEYVEDDLKEWSHHPVSGKLKSGDLGYYIIPYPDKP